MQRLLSLPPRIARDFTALEPQRAQQWFVGSDPAGANLGSGGGTMHLLREAWKATGGGLSFQGWIRQSRKLIVHAGGESRRLPAYAVMGKALIPMPVVRWSHGQRLDQTLLDLQQDCYGGLFAQAPESGRVMITSGDVLLRHAPRLPRFPEVDVLAMGLWVKPEQASHHGVFFCPRRNPHELTFFLQKPSAARIRELSVDNLFLVDVGVWILSEKALAALERKCGDPLRQYELYADFGLGLGARPVQQDPEVNSLTCAVIPLPGGEFYHFGTSRALIESVAALHNVVLDQTQWGLATESTHPDVHLQNCRFAPPRSPAHSTLWVENATVPGTWTLTRDHLITGAPDNDWTLELPPGICLDFVPVGGDRWCLRFYGIDDPFRGDVWLGQPAAQWFARRGLSPLGGDLQKAPLFPVLPLREWRSDLIQWLLTGTDSRCASVWEKAERLSAQQLMDRADVAALIAQRRRNREESLLPLAKNYRRSVFYKLDLEATAELYAGSQAELPPEFGPDEPIDTMKRVQDAMFRAAVLRHRQQPGWDAQELKAFAMLQDAIVREAELAPARPERRVVDDQIIWGRSPLRLDLAGGWTDTPPYCLQFGGRVVNVAVDLNGQPPIQVFARLSDRHELAIRSIDMGVEERVRTYEELSSFTQIGSGFTIAKAALALAGFLPRFSASQSPSLETQLREFGGGIEISLLSAVPKGSGLGTSSILAATVLGTLSELCGLGWNHQDLFRRTLALEQLLTTGGGWQDQVGGVLNGLKFIETEPGLSQLPTVRWLPAAPLCGDRTLLYYTGVTRVAAGILRQIVRKMFLNERETLGILSEIGAHARQSADALQKNERDAVGDALRKSWELNQRLDAGTNPPAIRAIFDSVRDYVSGAKLLGAGGGGFMLMVAKDAEAARRIREKLTERTPVAKARFVDLRVSEAGFQVTRS
ncbi:MAG: bifunctional fucokinase/L-fucose-1-P-guanylyltransferase [Verrucomicrobia bacterium]|nr:bifunctional fucokinase/L-fucose-1-P-guanylyltransferase [Verrucomicrobiota bacterium]MBI3867550.1 bifunctional fucokinase/L-fucose-1-P-guanylyltransferase [Verrucomicrobiota bacterium]